MALPSFVKIVNGWPRIDIGAMRHQITLLSLQPTSPPTYDGAGASFTWTAFSSAMAAIGAQAAAGAVRGGTDVIQGGQITSQLFLAIAIWYFPGITANMRITSDNGSTYVIQSVENVLEMNVILVLTCLAIGANDV